MENDVDWQSIANSRAGKKLKTWKVQGGAVTDQGRHITDIKLIQT